MKLYVLNPSTKKFRFTFRTPDTNQIRHVPIGPGQQEVVYDGGHDELHNIIIQNERYGLIEDTDVRAKRRGYTCCIFAVDRPVDVNSAQIAERMNFEALKDKGTEMRKVTAMAAAEVIETSVAQAGLSPGNLQDTTFTMKGEDIDGQPAVIHEDNVVTKGKPNAKPQ